MGVFKLPKNLCKEMNDAMAAFWWGDIEEQNRMHVCLVEDVHSEKDGRDGVS
jgi:hypothetical protein